MQQLYLLQGQYKIVHNNQEYYLTIDYKNNDFSPKNIPAEITSFALDLLNRKSGKNMLEK